MKQKLTAVTTLHYIRLVYRSLLFVMLLIEYFIFRYHAGPEITVTLQERPALLYITCLVFVVEMVMRFFPSRFESPGCQKQFKRNYLKSGRTDIVIEDNNATVLVLLIWITLNLIFGGLRLAGILDDGIMILLCSA